MVAGGEMTGFDPLQEPKAFRQALGQFSTGVTVITCDGPDGPTGITANSFCSVSLDPALVLWCPAKSSKRFAAYNAATHFAIHVVSAAQQTIAEGFIRNGSAFDGFAWSPNAHNVPLIEGCLARFECRQYAVHDAGDHAIIIGQVLHAATKTGFPLLFQAGKLVSAP